MKVPALASLPLVLSFALVSACSGNTEPPVDGSPGDTGTGGDGSMNTDSGTHMDATATDGPRMRDTGPEISLDSAFTMCLVQVSPRTGTTASTFVVTGTGFLSSPMIALTIGPNGGAPIVNMQVAVDSSGMFTYSLPGTGLAPGDYSATATDPSFTCTFTGPFTVTP